MITLGDLYDALQSIEQAERDLEEAKVALFHGGSPHTMIVKRQHLEQCELNLLRLRKEEIPR